MRSMKHPLGSLDTRLVMTDSKDDRFHSPSFASVISLDGMQPDSQGMGETDLIDCLPLSLPVRRSEKRYPRLELDAAMDRYHTLDGFVEPPNPQNTPASHSGSVSPQNTCRRIRTESLRTSSAPHALYIDWCPPGSSLNLLDNDDPLNPQIRCFSADDEPRSTAPISRVQKSDEAEDSHPGGSLVDIISSTRCVRFTPPPSSSGHPPRPIQRPMPTTERNKNYIASFRQKKQFERWRVAARTKTQRVSPYRSPKKSLPPASTRLDVHPEIDFSSKPSLHKETDPCDNPKLQEETDSPSHADDITSPTGCQRQLFDMVAVSLSWHHVRNAVISSDSLAEPLNLRFSYSLRPISSRTRFQDEEARNVSSAAMDDLLLYAFFIVPEFALRTPLAMLHFLDRFAHTRSGLAVLFVLRLFWSVLIGFVTPFLTKLGMDAMLDTGRSAKF